MTQTQIKAQLTKDAHTQELYCDDIYNELKHQYPQPDGSIYLHGERINYRILEYNIYVLNSLKQRRNVLG